jgi:hypothetical protein
MDSQEKNDVDSDGILDYPHGDDRWLNTTLPVDFPSPYAAKEVTVYIGPSPEIPVVTGLDTAYIFIDSDDESRTGYSIGNIALGADYLVTVDGIEGEIVSRKVERFSGSSPLSWEWTSVSSDLKAEIDSSCMEMGLDSSIMNIQDRMKVFFKSTDWKGAKDGSDRTVVGQYISDHLEVGFGILVGPAFDPFVVENQGDVHQSPDAATWFPKANPSESFRYVGVASGSKNTAGYVYVLRSDGKVYFTDRGVNGWVQYGYGSPPISGNTSYVDIATGSGALAGYVYVLRNDGCVFFTDRGVSGWYQYGYGSPIIEESSAYVSIASGSDSSSGYVYVLRNDGKVFFTDRGVSGWYQYGYGSPAIELSNAYVSIASGSGSTSGYVYVLRNDGKVQFTDRGVNGWYEYGYGSPSIEASSGYMGLASGSGPLYGYV